MKRLLTLLITFYSVLAFGQIYDPVQWDFSQKKLSNNEIELQLKATIDYPWHMYSQDVEDLMIATKINFSNSNNFEIIGKTIEGESIEEFDPTQEMVLKYFEQEAIFSQKIKVTSSKDFNIDGDIYFMVCDDKQCLPPEIVEFSFNLNGIQGTDVVDSTKLVEKEIDDGGSFDCSRYNRTYLSRSNLRFRLGIDTAE